MPHLRLFARASRTYTLDDTDERVQYTGAWVVSGQAPEYQSTTHFTRTPDAFLEFSFRGTQVRVVGTLGPTEMNHGPACFSYSLDGGERQGVVNTDTISDHVTRYNTQFVLLSSLPNTDHTLTMKHINGGPWFVDRLEVVLDIPDPEPSSTTVKEDSESETLAIPIISSTSQSSRLSSTQDRPVVRPTSRMPTPWTTTNSDDGSSTTVTVSPDRTSDTAISSSQPATQPNGLAIALGVVGALLLLSVLGFVGSLWVKKKRGTGQHHLDVNPFRPTVTEPSRPILAPMKGMPVLEDDSTMRTSEWTSRATGIAESSGPQQDSEIGSVNLSPPPYSGDT